MHDNEDHVQVCSSVSNDPDEPTSEGCQAILSNLKKTHDLDKFLSYYKLNKGYKSLMQVHLTEIVAETISSSLDTDGRGLQ